MLGMPYERHTIDLGTDDEGPVTATLVRRHAEQPDGRAVLYVHGFSDYFFQSHLADFYTSRGINFYALDLRKYGRSLLPHQTPNFCRDLSEYYPELDEAARVIRAEDGHDRLLVTGHSTGCLITALWAHDRRGTGAVDAMFFNSPFFDMNVPRHIKLAMTPIALRKGRTQPYYKMPVGLNDVYGSSIHRDRYGEWEYKLEWKPLPGFPVYAGWLRAILVAQKRLHVGLDIQAPIIVASSTASYKRARWGEAARAADSVLDVDHMARWTPALGRRTTLVRVEGGLHDLTLSAEPSRKQLFDELGRWMDAYFTA
ncbi:alpha/beta hydrolase [Planosporangium thailandense]|uniref:Alpha/beta hydrolase n=1 Tax=Planosporangium thailandense TaxID=765197 RepID=A0ABX0XXR5_9ACTN|nr:alpha/beta hydrolase [Planosporangium thailandense]